MRTLVNPKAWLALPLGIVLATAFADDKVLTKNDLAGKLTGVEAKDITDSPIKGLYQITLGSTIAYITTDGHYLFKGDIYDADTSTNITEETRSQARVAMLAAVDPKSMIVFKPKDGKVKHTVTIFTDVDCGYCRQFHREIDKVMALGIEVHYLFFPRTGPNTESWEKAERVWCAPDRNAALTKAKLGGDLPKPNCGSTPVEDHWSLGRKIGVRGTPSMFSESGELIGGYLPPATLLKSLDESAANAAKPN
ncbi:MAG TPA: DsbC family protein [Gammaproteobacteria bacterium]|nr:DsbC family protein [Gammaproteobacteria bacterium]